MNERINWTPEERAADARLRNAAPDMLAALRAILFQVVQGKVLDRDACITQARAAIVKAEGTESGFTLVELCIAVVIIGILAAIAIPAYSAMCDRAREACVKANMHNLQLAGEAFYVENDGQYGSVEQVMASDCAPTFTNPFTHATGQGGAWESLRRCGDATSGTRGIVAQGGDAFGFWVHGVGAKGTEILVLKSGEVVMDSTDPEPDPLPGGPVQ